nr:MULTISPECIES: 2Fe-2S iron-sulfur cluster-binding protein [Derxia]
MQAAPPEPVTLTLDINRERRTVTVDARTTLLDLLRETLGLTGTKKGCDHGQCGACTVLADGRRINACLSLAAMHDGGSVVTIEGLAIDARNLHPLQAAFVAHDAFQCGYCTPGQICSAAGMLDELAAGAPSLVTDPGCAMAVATDAEIRERMSGNLCRCSAYPNIVAAIREVADTPVADDSHTALDDADAGPRAEPAGPAMPAAAAPGHPTGGAA